MSNMDKRALREAAERAGQNDWEYVYTSDLSAPGRGYITVGGAEAIYCLNKAAGGVKQSENVLRYIAAANPATVLALLDELEAKDSRIGELEVIATDYGIKFQKSQDALKHQSLLHKSQMEAAKKRIAELERKEQHSERQSVIDALAGSGEEWSDIEEYMQKWDAERASADGKGE
ncbi:ead/Ea22-like family protein [Enterobacter asburiae]|uniref:ead/Ea22-like family protein n=1 Tax=Enterobacter asburiae TaxID=61645 RepID=UPI0021CA997E|nr:ead/Ea22-like family protein [Enterobacter asburiae]MCU3137277.1 ead/Ea22-like family protein [Enterobacter asburiae]